MKYLLLAIALCAAPVFAQEGRTYAPGPFDRLVISGQAKVELSQGERDQVFVVGDEAMQKNVTITVKNGRLTVETEDEWKFWNRAPVQLRVQMRDIRQLVISGASDIVAAKPIKLDALRVDISGQGQVTLRDLTAAQLRFDISGAGEGELAGKVDELQLRVSGKGKFVADRMKAARASVQISGIANADVWATDELSVSVSGIGTVNYWGQPRIVHRQASGISDVVSKGERK